MLTIRFLLTALFFLTALPMARLASTASQDGNSAPLSSRMSITGQVDQITAYRVRTKTPLPTSTPTRTATTRPTSTRTAVPSNTPLPTASPTQQAGHLYALAGQGRTYETLNPTLLQAEYNAGVRVRLVEPEWNAFQHGGPGEWNQDAVNAIQHKIDTFTSYGPDVRLILDLGMQYAPGWVSGIDPLADQYGNHWNDPRGGVNVYWSPTVRGYASTYIRNLFTTLNFHGKLWAVRVGPLGGELMYPNVHYSNQPESFWAFDSTAQAQSPVPGWRPGNPSPNQEAQRFYYWYTDNLASTFNWFLGQIRPYFAGYVAPVVAGGGMWPVAVTQLVTSNLTTTDPMWYGTGNYWYRTLPMMGAGDPNILLWSSSVGDGYGNDGDIDWWGWTAARQIAWMASQHGRPVFAENVGHNPFDTSSGADPRTTMQTIFGQMQNYGFSGMLWIRESDMSDLRYASLPQYASMIAQYH